MQYRCVLYFITETGETQSFAISKARDILTPAMINASMDTLLRNNLLNGPKGRLVAKKRATYTKTRKWDIPVA